MKIRIWAALAALSLALLSACAASLGANGRIDSPGDLGKIQVGATNERQVRDLLGAPLRTLQVPRGLQAMEYEMRDYSGLIYVYISIGKDGVVREVMRVRRSPAS